MSTRSAVRYAAFLRGVMPTNLKMPELKRCLEDAGFADVRTVLSSGNVVFAAPAARQRTLEQRLEKVLEDALGRRFPTIVRPVDALRELLDGDPYRGFRVPAAAKRVVTFLREAPSSLPPLPVERDGARILRVDGHEAFSAYVATPRGPVFMKLIEDTFGKDVTTRTWDTVKKVAAAAP